MTALLIARNGQILEFASTSWAPIAALSQAADPATWLNCTYPESTLDAAQASTLADHLRLPEVVHEHLIHAGFAPSPDPDGQWYDLGRHHVTTAQINQYVAFLRSSGGFTITETPRKDQPGEPTVPTSLLAMPRDIRLVHRLAALFSQASLPGDAAPTTGPRLAIVHRSILSRYWDFMTQPASAGPVPVPASILYPQHQGWREALASTDQQQTNEMLLEIYQLSTQDRVQLRDALRYTILRQGRAHDATQTHLAAYAARFVLQLGDILAAGGHVLQATTIHIPRPAPVSACRFIDTDLHSAQGAREHYQNPPAVTQQRLDHLDDLLKLLLPEARQELQGPGRQHRPLLIYQDNEIYRVAPRQERLWSQAQALHDADKVVADHMNPSEKG